MPEIADSKCNLLKSEDLGSVIPEVAVEVGGLLEAVAAAARLAQGSAGCCLLPEPPLLLLSLVGVV